MHAETQSSQVGQDDVRHCWQTPVGQTSAGSPVPHRFAHRLVEKTHTSVSGQFGWSLQSLPPFVGMHAATQSLQVGQLAVGHASQAVPCMHAGAAESHFAMQTPEAWWQT